MKGFIRFVTLGVIVTGWGLAATAMHMIRTPGNLILIPKDRLGFQDTYVDARQWTSTDLRQHPAVVARLIHLDRSQAMAFAVDNKRGNIERQLTYAVEHPMVPTTSSPVVVEKVTDQLSAAAKTVRSIFD
jgi:hypothetical protein